jgi:hypothetical protein
MKLPKHNLKNFPIKTMPYIGMDFCGCHIYARWRKKRKEGGVLMKEQNMRFGDFILKICRSDWEYP